jgi:hypothetical protein
MYYLHKIYGDEEPSQIAYDPEFDFDMIIFDPTGSFQSCITYIFLILQLQFFPAIKKHDSKMDNYILMYFLI